MNGERQCSLWFHRPKRAASDFEPDEAESDRPFEVWASMEPKSGNESEQGDQQVGNEAITIRLRYGPSAEGCNSAWWATRDNPLTGETETYEFLSVRNVGSRNRELEIDAVRVS